jgi:predicted TPR repeat methyltransferase
VKRATAHEKAGDWVEAASMWNRLVLLNPTMPSYWERMGEASKKSREYSNAIRGFRRALELGASYGARLGKQSKMHCSRNRKAALDLSGS